MAGGFVAHVDRVRDRGAAVIVPMNYKKSDSVREAADQIYADLQAAGVDVLLDDRDERAGVLLADSEHSFTAQHLQLTNQQQEQLDTQIQVLRDQLKTGNQP